MRYGGKTAPTPLNWGFAGSTNQKVKIMTRKFKVGDIVNGWCDDGDDIVMLYEKKLISSINGEFHDVGDYIFTEKYLTLVTPVEDTFEKWIRTALVTGRDPVMYAEKMTNDEVIAKSIANCAIKDMLKQRS